jgi:hypothetical protein
MGSSISMRCAGSAAARCRCLTRRIRGCRTAATGGDRRRGTRPVRPGAAR